jgi:hypothetical protein
MANKDKVTPLHGPKDVVREPVRSDKHHKKIKHALGNTAMYCPFAHQVWELIHKHGKGYDEAVAALLQVYAGEIVRLRKELSSKEFEREIMKPAGMDDL